MIRCSRSASDLLCANTTCVSRSYRRHRGGVAYRLGVIDDAAGTDRSHGQLLEVEQAVADDERTCGLRSEREE